MSKEIKKLSDTKIIKFIIDNRIYFFTMMITTTLYCIFCISRNYLPFGKYSAIVSDGYAITYPIITQTINNLKLWNFTTTTYSIGYFTDLYNISPLLLFVNPLRLILLIFPEKYSLLGFNLFHALEFILIGPSLIFYLTKRPKGKKMDKTNPMLIPIALAYNLSSYVLCYYSFWGFLDLVIIVPLMILAMERVIYEKKYLFYIILLSLYMIDSTYYAFLLCEFLFLYFFTLEHENVKNMLKNGLRFGLCSIYSAGIACFALVPFYLSTTSSGYSTNDSSALSSINFLSHSFLKSISDFEIYRDRLIVSDDWYRANTYCGILLVMMIPIFLQIKSIKLSTRIKRISLLVLLFAAYSNQFLNFVFHGFHLQSLVPNRFSIFCIFILVITFYDTLNSFSEIYSKKSIVTYIVFALLISFTLIYDNTNHVPTYVITILFLVFYFVIYLIGLKTANKKIFIWGSLASLCLELCISSIIVSPSENGFLSISPSSTVVMKNIIQKYSLDTNKLTRTELLNTSNYNSGCLINSNSSSILSSTLQKEQISLYKSWNVPTHSNNIEYFSGNPIANMFLNQKYYLIDKTQEEQPIPSYFKVTDESNNVILYEDPYVTEGLIHFPKSLANNFNSIDISNYNNSIDYQNDISKTIIDKPIYKSFKSDINIIDSPKEDLSIITIIVPSGIKGNIYLATNEYITYIGYADETHKIFETKIRFKSTDKKNRLHEIQTAIIDEDSLKDLSTIISKYKINDIAFSNNNEFSFSCVFNEQSEVYIPLPVYGSWNINVDGESKDLGVKKGEICINLAPGNHNIYLFYRKNLFIYPIIISLICIISIILYHIIKHKTDNIS